MFVGMLIYMNLNVFFRSDRLLKAERLMLKNNQLNN